MSVYPLKLLRIREWERQWLGDWGGKLTAVFGAFLVFHIIYVLFQMGNPEYQSLNSNLITLVIYAGPCIAAWRASSHPSLLRRARRAWRYIALANFSFLIGTVLWMYFENYLGEQPFPSWADAGYLAFYPLMFAGLFSMVEKFESREQRLNFWLDSSIVLIGGSLVVWYFLIRPMSASSDGDTLKTILTIAYPVGDLVLLLGISSLLMRPTAAVSRLPINFLLFGTMVGFIADFAFSYQTLHGTYATGAPVDALFTAACFPIMLAAHAEWTIASRTAPTWEPAKERNTRNFWVPYLAVAAAFTVLLAVVFETPSGVLDAVMGAACLVTALVIFRQFMFVRANTKANLALGKLQNRIQGIYAASTDAMGLADFEGTLAEVNDSFLRLTGFHREEIVGVMKYQQFLPDDSLHRSSPPDFSRSEFERTIVRRDGTTRSIAATLYPVNDSLGKPTAMALIIRDITDRRLLEDKLTHQALHDALTGLANRSLLHNRIAAAISRAKRKKTEVALLFLDLDNFKTVNDTLGHAAGDSLLCTVAERLRNSLRLSDTPARLGGDEFAILLEDIERPGEEFSVAERLLEEIQQPIEIQGKQVFVGASIGIANYRLNETPDDLLRNADVAMYTAKRNGKNRFTVFKEEMHEAVLRLAGIEEEMRKGLEKGEFKIKYQPIVELASEKIVGFEALLRWEHPRGLLIGPDEFIPIAEKINLIESMGRFVAYEACAQVGKWNRTIAKNAGLFVSVNISSRQFLDDGFMDMIADACRKGKITASDLILEITESTMLNNAEATVNRLEAINSQGIRLAIDDFGTGYSSLSYLHKYPISILKIDRSFVENIGERREGAGMVGAIISMSQTLNMITIAEGIEDALQAETLTTMGCQWGQGYYFACPLDPQQIEELLLEKQATAGSDRDGERSSSGLNIGKLVHGFS